VSETNQLERLVGRSVAKGERRWLDAWTLNLRCAPTAAAAAKTGVIGGERARDVAARGAYTVVVAADT